MLLAVIVTGGARSATTWAFRSQAMPTTGLRQVSATTDDAFVNCRSRAARRHIPPLSIEGE